MSRTPALICLMGPNDMVLTRNAGGDLVEAPQPRRSRDAAAIMISVAPRKWRRGRLKSSFSFMVSSQLAQRLEGGAELAGEQLRLLPCCGVGLGLANMRPTAAAKQTAIAPITKGRGS